MADETLDDKIDKLECELQKQLDNKGVMTSSLERKVQIALQCDLEAKKEWKEKNYED